MKKKCKYTLLCILIAEIKKRKGYLHLEDPEKKFFAAIFSQEVVSTCRTGSHVIFIRHLSFSARPTGKGVAYVLRIKRSREICRRNVDCRQRYRHVYVEQVQNLKWYVFGLGWICQVTHMLIPTRRISKIVHSKRNRTNKN